MTVTDHAAGVLFDYLLPEDLEDQFFDTFPAVVISHKSDSTTVSLVVSAETALQLLDETVREVRALCAMIGNAGTMVELTQLEDCPQARGSLDGPGPGRSNAGALRPWHEALGGDLSDVGDTHAIPVAPE